MRFLRTAPTRRLLAAIAGVLAAILAGTAIAIAAVGSGPVPKPKPLAQAVHAALSAPAVSGVSARITFTNHLIDSGDIQGIDPLLMGGSGRLWISPGHGLRIELQSANGDAQIVVNQTSFWAYDPLSDTVYEGRLPAEKSAGAGAGAPTRHDGIPTVAQIESVIQRLAGHVTMSGAIPGDVAGRPVYTVRFVPRTNGGLLGGAALSWDAQRGVPLRFALYARGDSSPVLELAATDISYGSVPASVFAMSPPSGAHVVRLDLPLGAAGSSGAGSLAKQTGSKTRDHEITGVKAVSPRLSFALVAPAGLAGQARRSVSLLGRGSHAGALVAYGNGLGGIYVIERPAGQAKAPGASANADGPGLHLPSVSIGGVQAQELPTALGTVLTFTRSGVSYTVAGSVSRATIESAARSL